MLSAARRTFMEALSQNNNLTLGVVLLASFCACGSDPATVLSSNDGNSARDAGTDNPAQSSGQGDGAVTLPVDHSDASTEPGTTEICDGIDNDQNGIIDDVDVGGDGICDCLKIATIGAATYPDRSTTFEQWLDARSSVGTVVLASQELTPALLAPLQVIIVQDVRSRAYSPAEIGALDAWVRGGGGLFTLTGYVADPNVNINAILQPYGMSYGSTLVMAFAAVTLPVTHWNPHPVTLGIDTIGVQGAYEVRGEGADLAEGDDILVGSVVLLRANEHGNGKVLVWGDEWITFDSEWSSHPDYQVSRLWQNALKWLTPATECQVPVSLR